MSGTILPGRFLTNVQKLTKGIWPWTTGPRARLPLHYKMSVIDKHMKEPVPVHFTPDLRKYDIDEYGVKRRVQNIPIPILYPTQSNDGLWGGEGIIKGYFKKKNRSRVPRIGKYIMPRLYGRALYSEILDRWMSITVTLRTLDLIDEAKGFDLYILGTHEVDLKSILGMRLKREMLLALANKTLYPHNIEKQEKILTKYEEYMRPVEEIEWLGLTIDEAVEKLLDQDESERLANIRPLRDVYLEELVEDLKKGLLTENKGEEKKFLSFFNPMKDKEKDS